MIGVRIGVPGPPRVVYREQQREVQALAEAVQTASLQVQTGLNVLRHGELQQEGQHSQQI